MNTGDEGPTPPDAEHYLDLSGIEDDQSGPHFDVVLRGYDRRQVDDHVAGLRRMNAQLRAQLAVLQRRRSSGAGARGVPEAIPEAIPEARTPAEGSDAESPDVYGAFNDRLRGILQAAEQEAQMVRSRAAESLLAEHAESRAALADLRAQRDSVFDDLVRLRGWLDELVTTAGRPSGAPPSMSSPAPSRPGQWPSGPQPSSPQPSNSQPSSRRPSNARPVGPNGGFAPRPHPRPQPRPGPARDTTGSADADTVMHAPVSAATGPDADTGADVPTGVDTGVDADTAATTDGADSSASDLDADTTESRAVPADRSAG